VPVFKHCVVINLMFLQSNRPPTELVFSAVLVRQFGTASQRNISETFYVFNQRYVKTFLFASY